MTTVGFILFIIGCFKQDKRFTKAAIACVVFDLFAIVLAIIVALLEKSGIFVM